MTSSVRSRVVVWPRPQCWMPLGLVQSLELRRYSHQQHLNKYDPSSADVNSEMGTCFSKDTQ